VKSACGLPALERLERAITNLEAELEPFPPQEEHPRINSEFDQLFKESTHLCGEPYGESGSERKKQILSVAKRLQSVYKDFDVRRSASE